MQPMQENTIDFLESYCQRNNVPLHVAAVANGSPIYKRPDLWPEVIDELEDDEGYSTENLIQRDDILTRVSAEISKQVEVPVDTIYLFGLGCVASALTKGFSIKYKGNYSIPVNLYVIAAQPPGVGKSHINNCFTRPIHMAYKDINDANRPRRELTERRIKRLEKEADKTKDEKSATEALDQLQEEIEELDNAIVYNPILTDTTIEGAANVASKQGGMFNIISAESESVNVITGAVYGGESGGTKNFGLLLSAWDGEFVSVSRITRGDSQFQARASISILAQDQAIDTIMAAGAEGRGLTERFFLLKNPHNMGSRKFPNYKANMRAFEAYNDMITEMINAENVIFEMSEDAATLLQSIKMRYEPQLSDDGKFGRALLRGFIAKADKHITKIAAVLCGIDNYCKGGSRSNEITEMQVNDAHLIFNALAETYIKAGDSLGFVGERSEAEKVKEKLMLLAGKNKLKTNITWLRDSVKKVKPFIGTPKITNKLKNDILPKLEAQNYCVVKGNEIYINPRLS